MGKSQNIKKILHLVLIRPSKYDQEGYILRYKKGVLPSNTLAVLYGLSRHALQNGSLGTGVSLKIDVIDETVCKIHYKQLIRTSRSRRVQTLVCLCGVQTNQFPLGFPHDTEASIREDLARLTQMGFSQASFFVMTPLPGSLNHQFVYTRAYLNSFWAQVKGKLRRGKLLQVNFVRIVFNFLFEIRLLFTILWKFLMIKIRGNMALAGQGR